jgi:hypothetical protein
MLIIWSDTRRGGALKETVRFEEAEAEAGRLAPAPKKAFELISVLSRPVSCAFCLKASARC